MPAETHPPQKLIVFSRFPEAGKTKTRMIRLLGPQKAADLQREMTRHTLGWARRFRDRSGVNLEVRHAGGDSAAMAEAFGHDLPYVPQGEGDLGDRMARAADDAFDAGHGAALIVGTDCPALTADVLTHAAEALGEHDLVIVPATDGGYVLIGLSRRTPELFQNIDWGSEHVCEQTLAAAERARLKVCKLGALDDVDRPDDLPIWEWARARFPPPSRRLAVVIPTLNEAAALPALLDDLAEQRGIDLEILVADGGSSDGTPDIARRRGARVIRSERGRGAQLNAGAAASSADVLLFLHADSRLEHAHALAQALDALDAAVAARGTDAVAGHFRLRFAGQNPQQTMSYRYIEEKTAFNRPGTTNGDQGFLMRSAFFRRLGGFETDLPFLEDQRLAEKIRADGFWFTLPGRLTTSARRFEAEGFHRLYILMGMIMGLHHAGVKRFFELAPGAYRAQQDTGRLQLTPFFRIIWRIMREMGLRPSLAAWYRVGRYIRENSWQMFYFADIGLRPTLGPKRYPFLRFHDAVFAPLTAHPLGNAVTAAVAFAWFMGCLATYFRLEEQGLIDI